MTSPSVRPKSRIFLVGESSSASVQGGEIPSDIAALDLGRGGDAGSGCSAVVGGPSGRGHVGPPSSSAARGGDFDPAVRPYKNRWIWFPKAAPLSVSTVHLGFAARAAEVRRFGAGSRRLSRSEPRLVDSRSFASVVGGFGMDQSGGPRRDAVRGENWGGGGFRGYDKEGFTGGQDVGRSGGKRKAPDRGDGWGPDGGRGFGDGGFQDGGSVYVPDNPNRGTEKQDKNVGGGSEFNGSDDANDKIQKSDKQSDVSQKKLEEAMEEHNSDVGGKVDIPEFFEDISDDEPNEDNTATVGGSHEDVCSDQMNVVNLKEGRCRDEAAQGDAKLHGSVTAGDVEMDAQLAEDDVRKGKKRIKHQKKPPVAQRFSTRIKRDGVPIQIKAQNRMDQINDVSGGIEDDGAIIVEASDNLD
ncbi:hypothetical protein GUJ93_ZPchr0004g38564 [Zizania palustris]|uniref:Uncharacterized protein n=1 Tax=Zizania palustris TaxID=103762 RepID=A0A8J5T168_ZIZPA|nr:hypothetical protein GUJ93_ZPchr0004g38564 [Zizania palustris]